MVEQEEFSNRLNEQIEGLKKQADGLRTSAEGLELQAEYLSKQWELFEKYGAKVPIAMQTAQFMIEQIAAVASSLPSLANPPEISVADRGFSTRSRRPTSRRGGADQTRNYSIAPQVKSIMNGIFSSGEKDVPEDLNSLFDRMYGQNWHLRTINVPTKPGLAHVARTYAEDLHSPESYIRSLIRGADRVINRNMRGNTPPNFPYKGRVAAVELAQLYSKIDAIGWDVYDNFMVNNSIR